MSLIVVASDLNLIEMEKCIFLEKEFLLKPVINKEQVTHKKRNHLDNFWTNLTMTKTEFMNGLFHISDHALFKVSVRFGEDVKRTTLIKLFILNVRH